MVSENFQILEDTIILGPTFPFPFSLAPLFGSINVFIERSEKYVYWLSARTIAPPTSGPPVRKTSQILSNMLGSPTIDFQLSEKLLHISSPL